MPWPSVKAWHNRVEADTGHLGLVCLDQNAVRFVCSLIHFPLLRNMVLWADLCLPEVHVQDINVYTEGQCLRAQIKGSYQPQGKAAILTPKALDFQLSEQ